MRKKLEALPTIVAQVAGFVKLKYGSFCILCDLAISIFQSFDGPVNKLFALESIDNMERPKTCALLSNHCVLICLSL